MEDDDFDNFDYDAILNQTNTQNTQSSMTPIPNTQPSQTQMPPPSNTQVSQSVPDSTPSPPVKVERKPPPQSFTRIKAFGKQSFSSEERERIRNVLHRKLTAEDVKTRPGPSGGEYTYISSDRAIELANETFKFNGWSCSIVEVTPDFIEERDNKVRYGVSAVVRVTLRDGTHHEDVGFGCQENASKALALENAKKEAISDARKRALRLYGNYLGNCLYDKEHTKKVKNVGGGRPQNGQQMRGNPQYPVKNEYSQPPNNPHHNTAHVGIPNNVPMQPIKNEQTHSSSPPLQQQQQYNNPNPTPSQQSPPPKQQQYNHSQQPQHGQPPTHFLPQTNTQPQQNNTFVPQNTQFQQQNRTNVPPPRTNNWQPQNNAPINTISAPKASNFVPTPAPKAYTPPMANPAPPQQQQQQPSYSLSDSVDDSALEEALLLAESQYNQQQAGQKSPPPTNGDYQGLTPPDKKRKSGDGIFVN